MDNEKGKPEGYHLFLYDGEKGWLTLFFNEDGTVTWRWVDITSWEFPGGWRGAKPDGS